jgi:predicted NBD/HSP70 family sugar kinase
MPRPTTIRLTEVEHAVLRHVRRHPGCSRTEIAQTLDLSKSMLTKAMASFNKTSLIVEERSISEKGERGQPPIRVMLNVDAFHSIGLYVNSGHSVAMRSDLGGKVLQSFTRYFDDNDLDAPKAVVEDIGHLIASSPAPVLGVGHAVPAIVTEDGRLFELSPSQAKLPLPQIATAIATRFALPVYWENAAYCTAGFEANRPEINRGCLFHLTLDYGVGGGIVYDGRILRGAYNQAANLGALIPETGPRPSLSDLANHLGSRPEHLTEGIIADYFAAADPRLMAWIEDRGKRLSRPLATAAQLFNPDTIVVGGFFPREVLRALCAEVDLGVLDTVGRRPITKPDLVVTDLVGPSGFAEAATLLPIAARLLGQSGIPLAADPYSLRAGRPDMA